MTCAPTLLFSRLATKAYADGYALHGEINLQPESFENRLRCIFETQEHGPERPVEGFFANIHSNDLYLTEACSQLSEAAWRRFEAVYGPLIRDTCRYVMHSADAGKELATEMMAALFMPDRSGQCRIRSFDGRQSLASWLRIISCRRGIKRQALKWNTVENLEQSKEPADEHTSERIEAAIRRRRYEAIAEDSFKEACNSLTQFERLIMLLRYDQGLRLMEIASTVGIGRSRVIRSLQGAQSKLHKRVITLLSGKYGLGPEAVRECIVEMLENPSHSPLVFIKEQIANSPQSPSELKPL